MPPKSRSIPTTEEIQRTLFHTLEEHKKLITGVGAVIVLVVLGLVLFLTLSKRAEEKHWQSLLEVNRQPPITATAVLEDLLEEGGSEIAPHALLRLAVLRKRDKDYDGALELLDRLEKEYGETYLAALPSPDSRYSLVQLLRRRIEAEKAWDKRHAYESPEPDTKRVALVETTMGDFWVGFHPELAPKHVESFARQAKAGVLNGTKVYSVTDTHIQWGGEATKDDDPMNDRPEDEENLLDAEPGRYRIQQERGALSSVALEGGESPTRFAVVVGMMDLALDKKQTVFGKVLTDRGTAMAALDDIRNAPTYGTRREPGAEPDDKALEIPDHPVDDIVIERVSIWAGDEIEEGHEWDTAAVTPPKPEDEAEPGEKPAEEPGKAEESGEKPAEEKDG